MYLSRRMQTGAYALVYRQGLAEVLQIYNKVDKKTSLNQCPMIIRFGRDYSNQIKTPHGLKLSNQISSRKYFRIGNTDNSKIQSDTPPYRCLYSPSWGRWLIGSAISLVLSFWDNKRVQKLKRIQGEAELAMEGVEAVAEIVEKVATATEEMAKEMAEKLPEESKLKHVASVFEHISEVTAHEAHTTQTFIHKVEEITQDLDDLEAMIEPLIDKNVAKAETKQQK